MSLLPPFESQNQLWIVVASVFWFPFCAEVFPLGINVIFFSINIWTQDLHCTSKILQHVFIIRKNIRTTCTLSPSSEQWLISPYRSQWKRKLSPKIIQRTLSKMITLKLLRGTTAHVAIILSCALIFLTFAVCFLRGKLILNIDIFKREIASKATSQETFIMFSLHCRLK